MTTATDQARKFYCAVYDALTNPGDMKVYVDADDDYRVATTNVYGNHVTLAEWPALDAYMPDGDIEELGMDAFASMCVECHGTDVPLYSDDDALADGAGSQWQS